MTGAAAFLVLSSAFLHASWNALLRAAGDRLWSMAIMCLTIMIACGVIVPFFEYPAAPSWPYIAASAVLHVGYNFFLVRTYRKGDLGQTYSIARGASPVLVTLGAAAFAGEIPSIPTVLGIALISGGIFSLALKDRHLSGADLAYAFGTGCFIGAYSVTDGLGVRLAEDGIAYTAWLCLLWSTIVLIFYLIPRDWRSLKGSPLELLAAGGGGVVSILAYGIVIQAMSLQPMGPVSALRETSVVFAALLGRMFLRERLTSRRIAACAAIAIGAGCLATHTVSG